MSKEGSVAPKERVNITYKAATGDAQEQKELPLKMLVLGDFTGRKDERTVEERKPINIDKDNFDQVMSEQSLSATFNVPSTLSAEPGAELNLTLRFQTLADFSPDGVVDQVPELKALLELRNALIALKGPLGNLPAFRRKIQNLLGDDEARKKLMQELGITEA
jgi:type VI secretion system protein ImpB